MVWHKEGANAPLHLDSIIELMPCVSAIIDRSREESVLLDERKGRYWRLSSDLLKVTLLLGEFPNGQSMQDMVRHLSAHDVSEESFKKAINNLKASGLIKISIKGTGTHLEDSSTFDFDEMRTRKGALDQPTLSRSKQLILPDGCLETDFKQPALRLVLHYALLNYWYRTALRLRGWAPVWAVRSRQLTDSVRLFTDDYSTGNAARPEVIEEVIAATRLACVFPWVRPRCTQHSLALHHLLSKMGYSPKLVIGAKVLPFEPHMWVELNGYRIDSGVDEQSLDEFTLLLPQKKIQN